jgi:hypothetical protein
MKHSIAGFRKVTVSKLNMSMLMMFVVFVVSAGAADNAFTGKWKIDAPKSSWSDGKFPKNMSLEINMSFKDDEVTYHSINDTNKEKQPSLVDYTAKMDWNPFSLAGTTARYNKVAVRMLNKNQMEVLELKDDDVVVGAIYDLLPGGKRFVRRGIAKGVDGKSHEYEEFFDKQ